MDTAFAASWSTMSGTRYMSVTARLHASTLIPHPHSIYTYLLKTPLAALLGLLQHLTSLRPVLKEGELLQRAESLDLYTNQ